MNNINVLVINLKNRKDRKKAILKQLKKVFEVKQIKIFEAVNVDKAKENLHYLHTSAYKNITCNTISTCIIPTWGALGCALSHINCLKWISKNYKENEYYLIVEDDIKIFDINLFKIKLMSAISIFKKNVFNGELPNNKTNNLPNSSKKRNAIMVFLGFNNSIDRSKKYDYDLYEINKKFIGTHCYLVNKKSCDIILNKIFPIIYQIDIQYSFLNNKYNNSLDRYYLNMYNLINNGITQDSKFKSDVQYTFLSLTQIKNIFIMLPNEICSKIFKFITDLEYIRKNSINNNFYNNDRNSTQEISFKFDNDINYFSYFSNNSTDNLIQNTYTPTTTPIYYYNNTITPTYTYA